MGLFGNDPVVRVRLDRIERKLDAILMALGIETPAPTFGGGTPIEPSTLDEIRLLAASGKKIEAIKRLRITTGMGLKEAKDLIDAGL